MLRARPHMHVSQVSALCVRGLVVRASSSTLRAAQAGCCRKLPGCWVRRAACWMTSLAARLGCPEGAMTAAELCGSNLAHRAAGPALSCHATPSNTIKATFRALFVVVELLPGWSPRIRGAASPREPPKTSPRACKPVYTTPNIPINRLVS